VPSTEADVWEPAHASTQANPDSMFTESGVGQSSLSVDVGTIMKHPLHFSRYGYDMANHHPLIGALWDRFNGIIGYTNLTGSTHFFYGGIGLSIPLADQVMIGGSFAPGYYHDHGNLPLDSVLVFRSQGWIGFKYSQHQALSLDWHHFSNGGLGTVNAGVNVIGMTYHLQW
jgi:hypothetical protein